ncbi:MAG: GAF domain-containing protein [Terriglobales bacterium]
MKTYRLPRTVVAEIKQLVASDKPSPRPPSALVRILKLLSESRHYERAGVFLMVGGRDVPRAFSGPQAAAGPEPELSVPIKIAGRALGSLRVQLAAGHGFSPQEQVFLHQVAQILALYLTSKGKYVVRKTREALRETTAANSGEARGYQPASDKGGGLETRRVVAAGDKSRS